MTYLTIQKSKHHISGICVAALLLTAQAEAALYSFEFTATTNFITSNENEIVPGLSVGQPVSGIFSYEDTPNVNMAGRGVYLPSQGGISLRIGSTILSSGSAGTVTVEDNARPDFDRIIHSAPLNSGLWESGRIAIEIADFSQQALDSIDLPKQIDFSSFPNVREIRLDGRDLVTGSEVSALFRITSIALVPEPSVTLLFGLASVVSLIRRSREKS